MSGGGFDYSYEPVRKHVLDFIEEILTRYDVDGIELDYMRWCHLFPRGEGSKKAPLLTEFTVAARKLLDDAARRRGTPRLELGVRVPQTLEECAYLGLDVGAWVKLGLIDYVCPTDFFFTDINAKTEEFVNLARGTNCKVYPAIHPQVGWGTGPLMTLANYRAAARNFYAAGAAGLAPYNYQDFWASKQTSVRILASFPIAMGYLKELQDPQQVAAGQRDYFFYSLWYLPRASETGSFHDDNIYISRAEQLSGSRRFRISEDVSDKGLTTTLQVKALELAETEDLEIRINGAKVPDRYVRRTLVKDGRSPSGRGFPAYYQYVIGMNWENEKQPLVNGDNELWVKILQTEEAPRTGKVTIEELEVQVRVGATAPGPEHP